MTLAPQTRGLARATKEAIRIEVGEQLLEFEQVVRKWATERVREAIESEASRFYCGCSEEVRRPNTGPGVRKPPKCMTSSALDRVAIRGWELQVLSDITCRAHLPECDVAETDSCTCPARIATHAFSRLPYEVARISPSIGW